MRRDSGFNSWQKQKCFFSLQSPHRFWKPCKPVFAAYLRHEGSVHRNSVPMLSVHGTKPPLAHTPCWRSVVHRSNLHFFLVQSSITEHQARYSPDKTQDLIDAFLHEMESRKGDSASPFTGENDYHRHVTRLYSEMWRRVVWYTGTTVIPWSYREEIPPV
jgi:hypothetical protein